MLPLLTALDQMQATLFAADAPARQLAGVAAWRDTVAAAVAIGSRYRRPAGLSIDTTSRPGPAGQARPNQTRFLHGHATHAAWRGLCLAILDALQQQRAQADRFTAHWERRAKLAYTPRTRTYATEQANTARSWSAAAAAAENAGRALIATEDAIQVPVGRAICRVGFHEVAADKHYHQRGTR